MSDQRARIKDVIAEAPKDSRLIIAGLKKYFYVRKGLRGFFGEAGDSVKAVDNIDLHLRDNETVGIVGESGCGKTTLGRLISQLILPSEGQILYKASPEAIKSLNRAGEASNIHDGYVSINELRKSSLKILRREVTMIFQDPYSSFDPRYTVKGILEEPLIVHEIPPSERLGLIRSIMEEMKLVPVEDFIWRYPHMLSGGQRQRLGIGRALILGPSLLIADEPVSMLDVSIRAEILELLMEEKRKRHLSYIFITHDLAVARYVCDRIAVMYLGRIVEEGNAKTIIDTPCHPYSRALVSAVPIPDPKNRFKVKELPIYGEIPSARNVPAACRFHPRCPYVFDRCRIEDPEGIRVREDHSVACWLGDKLCQ